jgi:hypothetical protein
LSAQTPTDTCGPVNNPTRPFPFAGPFATLASPSN